MTFRNLQFSAVASKLFFIAVIILLGSPATYAQTSIAIAPNKMNMFYVGVDNPVSVAASGGSDEKVTVSITGGGGTASKMDNGLYNIRVAEPTDRCVVSVYVDGKLAGSSNFRVRNLPQPIATIGGFESGQHISSSVFQSQAGVAAYVPNLPFEVAYKVIGFTFTVDTEKGDVKSTDCDGNIFSSTAKEYINQYVKAGRTVTIDKIRVKGQSGREYNIPALVYYIK